MVYSVVGTTVLPAPHPQLPRPDQELLPLSRQIVTGDDKDDEAIVARADAVRTEAIHAIEEFLNQ